MNSAPVAEALNTTCGGTSSVFSGWLPALDIGVGR